MSQARCRIYLFTYRRSHLLGRALASLQAQTMQRWVCEVHNDDPQDREPGRIVEALGDDRMRVVNHERNLGAMASYNLAFTEVSEPYTAMLQDDNWWADDFLEVMCGELDEHPDVKVAICNQWIVSEQPDGSWKQTGLTARPTRRGVFSVAWPHMGSVVSARYADGSTVMRSGGLAALKVPESAPFDLVEPLRERLFDFPLLYLAQPRAYFAHTLATARTQGSGAYAACQALLAASFFRHTAMDEPAVRAWLDDQCSRSVPPWNLLILTGLADPACRFLWRYVPRWAWARFAAGVARRPARALEAIRLATGGAEWAGFIDAATQRQAQALSAPPTTFSNEVSLCSE